GRGVGSNSHGPRRVGPGPSPPHPGDLAILSFYVRLPRIGIHTSSIIEDHLDSRCRHLTPKPDVAVCISKQTIGATHYRDAAPAKSFALHLLAGRLLLVRLTEFSSCWRHFPRQELR